MRKNRGVQKLEPIFVDVVPKELDEGKLYIATTFRAVMHKCACGCGTEVSTPLHPTGWAITFDGVTVSLWPSVGNWSEVCQSHYWIDKSQVFWARRWTRDEIGRGREERRSEIESYHRGSSGGHDRGGGHAVGRRNWERLWLGIKTWMIARRGGNDG